MRQRSRVEAIAAFFRPRQEEPAERRAGLLLSRERYAGARSIVAAFYAVLLFFAVSNLYQWPAYLGSTNLSPRWPVFWLRFVDLRLGITWILWFNLLGGLLAVTLVRYRVVRILIFLSVLEFLAFKFSFGSINHGDHLGLLISFVLIFLPAGWHRGSDAPRAVRTATLLVFSACQGMILLIYSMSGMWKVGGVVRQVVNGEVTYLSPEGLAQQVAAKLLSDESITVLGPWLIDNYWVGWFLMVGALYLEFFSLWALPRPSLHQVWGFGLIFLHLSTHLTMGVGFARNSLWLALFLVFSPFRPEPPRLRKALAELPVLGTWISRLGRREAAAS